MVEPKLLAAAIQLASSASSNHTFHDVKPTAAAPPRRSRGARGHHQVKLRRKGAEGDGDLRGRWRLTSNPRLQTWTLEVDDDDVSE